MKNNMVKIFTFTCLLLGAVNVQAQAVEKRVWEEISHSGIDGFVEAVRNADASYIDSEGKISLEGIGYASQWVIGQEAVGQIVPPTYLSVEGLGRLVFILNGLYNADGTVRQSITSGEFIMIGQGVGWFVPMEAAMVQRLISLDQALMQLDQRVQAGVAKPGEINIITEFLQKLTSRSLAGQVDPAQISNMNNRIHAVEDGEWTLAMRGAARNEALVATTPAINELKATDANLANRLDAVGAAVESNASGINGITEIVRQMAITNRDTQNTLNSNIQGVSNRLDGIEVDASSALAAGLSGSNRNDLILAAVFGALIMILIAWATYLTVTVRKQKLRALKNPTLTEVVDLGNRVKPETKAVKKAA